MKEKYLPHLHLYRFELLLGALMLLLFDKIFFSDSLFFTRYVWPANMILLGFASAGIFKERYGFWRWTKNILFLVSLIIPLIFAYIVQFRLFTQISFLLYMAYYTLIFVEVMRQIVKKTETTVSVVFGSVSGFLLLIVIAQFCFLLLEYNVPHSFNGLTEGNIPSIYNQLSYFSMVSLATVGYGDIAPISEKARLLTMFFTIIGQFYMVALVGIIISRFSAISH